MDAEARARKIDHRRKHGGVYEYGLDGYEGGFKQMLADLNWLADRYVVVTTPSDVAEEIVSDERDMYSGYPERAELLRQAIESALTLAHAEGARSAREKDAAWLEGRAYAVVIGLQTGYAAGVAKILQEAAAALRQGAQ